MFILCITYYLSTSKRMLLEKNAISAECFKFWFQVAKRKKKERSIIMLIVKISNNWRGWFPSPYSQQQLCNTNDDHTNYPPNNILYTTVLPLIGEKYTKLRFYLIEKNIFSSHHVHSNGEFKRRVWNLKRYKGMKLFHKPANISERFESSRRRT